MTWSRRRPYLAGRRRHNIGAACPDRSSTEVDEEELLFPFHAMSPFYPVLAGRAFSEEDIEEIGFNDAPRVQNGSRSAVEYQTSPSTLIASSQSPPSG